MNYVKKIAIVVTIFFLTGCSEVPKPVKTKDAPPNILLILVDDMGYNALSSYGSKPWRTPNIDRLVTEGTMFMDAYTATVCSPTRAALLTGRYPARVDVTNWIPGWAEKTQNPKLIEKPFKKHLPLQEYTIAEAFKDNGYATALVGKWHLGEDLTQFPDKQGFDFDYMASPENTSTWFVEKEEGLVTDFSKTDAEGKEFLTEHLADIADDWLKKRDEDQPWFLYFSTHVVHKPIAAKEELVAKYKAQGLPDTGVDAADYAAMHEHMDTAIGHLLQSLKEIGQEENTIVVFLSDNGGREPQTVNTPFRGGKGELLEGGIRVPLIMKWPNKIPSGASSKVPVICEDLFPTLLDLADLELMPKKHRDGVSFKALLETPEKKETPLAERSIFWHYPHYNSKTYGKPSSAMRKGKWKLIDVFEFEGPELYNIEDDPGERNDLAEMHPEILTKMMNELDVWREGIGAKIPEPNSEYDPNMPSGWPQQLAN